MEAPESRVRKFPKAATFVLVRALPRRRKGSFLAGRLLQPFLSVCRNASFDQVRSFQAAAVLRPEISRHRRYSIRVQLFGFRRQALQNLCS